MPAGNVLVCPVGRAKPYQSTVCPHHLVQVVFVTQLRLTIPLHPTSPRLEAPARPPNLPSERDPLRLINIMAAVVCVMLPVQANNSVPEVVRRPHADQAQTPDEVV